MRAIFYSWQNNNNDPIKKPKGQGMHVISVKDGQVIRVGDDIIICVKEVYGEVHIEVDADEITVQENNQYVPDQRFQIVMFSSLLRSSTVELPLMKRGWH